MGSLASQNIEYRRDKTPFTPLSPAARRVLASSPHSPLRTANSQFGGQLSRSYAHPSKLTPRLTPNKRLLTPSRTPRAQLRKVDHPTPSSPCFWWLYHR